MSTDQFLQATYLGLFAIAIAGSYIVSNRQNLSKTMQQAAIWMFIFLGMIGAYGLWDDIQSDVSREQALTDDGTIEVRKSPDGHYHLTLNVNDAPIDFVVDTGASQIVLTQADARRIGIDTADLAYLGSASTANGVVRTALVTLDTIELGNTLDQDLPAVVNEGEMDGSLLGMTYLSRFDRIEIANDRLILTP